MNSAGLAPFAAAVQSGREDAAIPDSPLAASAHLEVEVPLDGIVH